MSKYTWLACLATTVALTACNSDGGDTANETPQSSNPAVTPQPVSNPQDTGSTNNTNPSTQKKVEFSDMRGNAGNMSRTGVINGVADEGYRSVLPDFGVRLYRVLQTTQDFDKVFDKVKDFDGFIAYSPNYVPTIASTAPIAPLTQADYFDRNTVIIVDYHSSQYYVLTLVEVSELADKIQVTLEMCSRDSMFIGNDRSGDLWFAIPKTTKPVEVLPLRYPPNPGWHPFNPEMGTPKCSDLVSKDGK